MTTHPPNSSGLVALQILEMLQRFEAPPATAFGSAGVSDASWIHLGLEASKLAMADRDTYLGDPAAVDVPAEWLLSAERIGELAARIDPLRATPPPAGTNPPGGGTIYLAVVDGILWVFDLQSSNGIAFRGKKIKRRKPILLNDVLQLPTGTLQIKQL